MSAVQAQHLPNFLWLPNHKICKLICLTASQGIIWHKNLLNSSKFTNTDTLTQKPVLPMWQQSSTSNQLIIHYLWNNFKPRENATNSRFSSSSFCFLSSSSFLFFSSSSRRCCSSSSLRFRSLSISSYTQR